MEARLTIVGGKASRKVVTVKLPAVIGRSRDADLTIAHPMVSRRHCELFEVQGLVRIRDLGSLNGTLVGGKEITEAPLRPNDQFSIGPLTFRVDYDYAGDVTVAAPIVPEEMPEEPAAPPAPPVSAGDELPPFFSLPIDNPPQGLPEASGQPTGQSVPEAGQRLPPPAIATREPAGDLPPLAVAPPGDVTVEPFSRPAAASPEVEPVAPPSRFGDVASTVEPSSPGERVAELSGPGGLLAENEGPAKGAGFDSLSGDSAELAADEFPLPASPSESSPFGEPLGEAPSAACGPAQSGGQETLFGAPDLPAYGAADGPTMLADSAELDAPPASPFDFEPTEGELPPGFAPGPELASGPPTTQQPEGQSDAPVLAPGGAPPAKKAKRTRRWWPFGRQKIAQQTRTALPEEKPVPGEPAGSKPPTPYGGQASPPAAPETPAQPALSPGPPPAASPPRQADAGVYPDLEAFLRDLQ